MSVARFSLRPRAAALASALGLAVGAWGCRGLIGIEDRPLLADAGDDAGVEASAPVSFCATLSPPAQFCSDFDDGALTGWANEGKTPNPGESGGGTMVVGTLAHSAPFGLRVDTPALVGTSSNASSTLQKYLPNAPRISVGFQMYLESEEFPVGQGGFVILASLAFDQAGGVIFYRTGSGTWFGVAPSGERKKLPIPVGVGSWKNVKMVLRNTPLAGGVDGEAYLVLDGSVAVTVPLPAAFQSAAISPRISLGAAGTGPAGAFRASFDDVAIYYGD